MRVFVVAALLITGVSASLSGCTWVKMAPGAEKVKVTRLGQDMSSCQRRGVVVVSVKDRLGPVDRNALKVRDELEVLARNEAPGLQADTVQPINQPVDGEQRYAAFACGSTPMSTRSTPADEDNSGNDVVPIRE